MNASFILYVKDQKQSADFYRKVFLKGPVLDVPGMTMFELNSGTTLGLMPEKGIKSLLGDKLPDPEKSNGLSRAELYLNVDDPETYHQRAIASGGKELSPLEKRNWGEVVAYSLDLDGHVLAFAKSV